MGTNTEVPVKAAKTTFAIIETLQELEGAGVTELAEYLNKPKSTVHDHLRTLEEHGYVVKNGESYQVGIRFLSIGGQARERMEIFKVAQPEVQKLAQETGEHANLMVEDNGYGIFIYIARGENAVQLDIYEGMRMPLQSTALGKSMLAFFDEDRIHQILDRVGLPSFTENTVTDRDVLFQELEEIRERGYATDYEERIQGMCCIGGPITDSEDQVIGAVSVSTPTSRMENETFEKEIRNEVLNAANVIQINLAYSEETRIRPNRPSLSEE